jgi:hypothetical protein
MYGHIPSLIISNTFWLFVFKKRGPDVLVHWDALERRKKVTTNTTGF